MKRRSRPTGTPEARSCRNKNTSLKHTDVAVLKYLDELIRVGGEETCTISIPKIADACDISERQVQICTGRLIKAGLIERIGYDLSNTDRTKRGTIYRRLPSVDKSQASSLGVTQKSSVKFLLFWREDS